MRCTLRVHPSRLRRKRRRQERPFSQTAQTQSPTPRSIPGCNRPIAPKLSSAGHQGQCSAPVVPLAARTGQVFLPGIVLTHRTPAIDEIRICSDREPTPCTECMTGRSKAGGAGRDRAQAWPARARIPRISAVSPCVWCMKGGSRLSRPGFPGTVLHHVRESGLALPAARTVSPA